MCITKKSSRLLRRLGRIHAGRLRHYAPQACAPYLKVDRLLFVLSGRLHAKLLMSCYRSFTTRLSSFGVKFC